VNALLKIESGWYIRGCCKKWQNLPSGILW